jgi:putative methyltransferase (TIGR04325 family)
MSAAPLLKSFVPPLLWNIGSRIKRRLVHSTTLLEYAPGGWSTRLPGTATSDDFWTRLIAEEQASCERLIARIRAHEPVLDPDGDENSKYALFGYVLALATRLQPAISVLDYGGNLGFYYWLGRALVPGVDVDYHCKELPRVAEAGRSITPDVTWHTDDGCLARPYDLVMFSSSLQCLRDWEEVLFRAGQSARRYLFLSDVATVRQVPAYVCTHRSHGHTFLQIQLNRSQIIATAERAGLRLVREFDMGPHPPIVNAPEQPRCLGWLFERGQAQGRR